MLVNYTIKRNKEIFLKTRKNLNVILKEKIFVSIVKDTKSLKNIQSDLNYKKKLKNV